MSGLRGDLAKTQARLDELPPGSVVIDRYGHAWQNDRIYWYRAYGDEVFSSWGLAQSAPIHTVTISDKPMARPARTKETA